MQKRGGVPTKSDSAQPGRLDSGMAARERNAGELSPYLAILLYQGTRMVLGEGAHALLLAASVWSEAAQRLLVIIQPRAFLWDNEAGTGANIRCPWKKLRMRQYRRDAMSKNHK